MFFVLKDQGEIWSTTRKIDAAIRKHSWVSINLLMLRGPTVRFCGSDRSNARRGICDPDAGGGVSRCRIELIEMQSSDPHLEEKPGKLPNVSLLFNFSMFERSEAAPSSTGSTTNWKLGADVCIAKASRGNSKRPRRGNWSRATKVHVLSIRGPRRGSIKRMLWTSRALVLIPRLPSAASSFAREAAIEFYNARARTQNLISEANTCSARK